MARFDDGREDHEVDLLVVQDPMATTETTDLILSPLYTASPNFRNRLIEKMDHDHEERSEFHRERGGAKEEGGTVNTDAMSEDAEVRALDALKI